MESLSSKKRPRSDSDESGFDSVEAKRILLDILDDSDVPTVSHDLDSFMKSFQDEISPAQEAVGLTSNSADRQELGFLFEASDDELGLPPTDTNTSFAESVELGELWGIDDQFLSYGSFEYEVFHDDVSINSFNNGEYVVLDGLFDHTDLGFGPSDLSWRPETLPAQ
ncbi:hypothetical protein E3N88_37664 [Mikania micrantha]|uniref:Uncharacterized protein n=1 Tax=Mikania micrantha TaxID=192012 RepID=A0A5N6LRQ6_9ASTR|nr:hypothetical protein E3N88_37664 [Mikania micrantha]